MNRARSRRRKEAETQRARKSASLRRRLQGSWSQCAPIKGVEATHEPQSAWPVNQQLAHFEVHGPNACQKEMEAPHEPDPLTPSLSPSAGERVSARTGEGVVHGFKARTNVSGNSLPKGEGRGEGESGAHQPVRIYNATLPFTDDQPAIKWDGEWHITIEVFRDLGLAFAAVLVLIYVLMVGWFRSFLTPLVVMMAIPFSLVGILPAHGAMGAFFTATSMIGFMAGAGIVVRNSIILVDFIEQRLREGMPLAEAVVDAGAVRFRPMLLTALAVIVGAAVILADPIFQGLAISLMAGEIASLLISRMAVPVLYFMANDRGKPTSLSPPGFVPPVEASHFRAAEPLIELNKKENLCSSNYPPPKQ